MYKVALRYKLEGFAGEGCVICADFGTDKNFEQLLNQGSLDAFEVIDRGITKERREECEEETEKSLSFQHSHLRLAMMTYAEVHGPWL